MKYLAFIQMIPPKIRFAIGAAIVAALESVTGLLGAAGEYVLLPLQMLMMSLKLLPTAQEAAESAMLLISLLV